MNQKLLYPALTLFLGAAGGFFVGKSGKPASADETNSAAEMLARTSRSGSLADSKSSRSAGSGRPRSADDINQMPGQLQRMQSLLEFYAGLSPEQLEEEAKKLESIAMPERMHFRNEGGASLHPDGRTIIAVSRVDDERIAGGRTTLTVL
jgi:hypothetical protein